MFASLGNAYVGLVFCLNLFWGVPEMLCLVLVLVSSVTGGGEELCEMFVLALEMEGVGLGVGELCVELLESDFEIPVFLLEFV
jgi:hypothetical protein